MSNTPYRPSSNKKSPAGSNKGKVPPAAPPRRKGAAAKKGVFAGLASRIRDYNFSLRKQKYKYGTIATIFTIAVVASVILLNVLIGILTDRYSIKFDMTSDRRFEITKETKDILKNLEEKVIIDVFSTEDDFRSLTYGNEMAEILYKFKAYGGDMVDLTFVDPLRNPTYADKYKSEVTIEKGTVVVKKGEYFAAIVKNDLYYWYDSTMTQAVGTSIERLIASKIISLGLREEDKPTAAILWGHNELNLGQLGKLLAENSYNVITLNLLTQDIPEEVSLLVINSPNTDYSEEEIEKIEKYIARRKNLIFFYGSQVPKLTNLELLFREWGLTFGESVVCDSNYRVLGEYYNVVAMPSATDHELTAGLDSSQFVILPFSRELHLNPVENDFFEETELLKTSAYSYSKSLTGEALESYEREDGDKSGPFSGAVLLTRQISLTTCPSYQHFGYLFTVSLRK